MNRILKNRNFVAVIFFAVENTPELVRDKKPLCFEFADSVPKLHCNLLEAKQK